MSLRIDIQSHELMTSVAAATQEDAGFASVEIRSAEIVFRGAVAAVAGISPDAEIRLTRFIAFQRIGGRSVGILGRIPVVGFTGLSVEIEQVFVALAGVLGTGCIVIHVPDLDVVSGRSVDIHIVCAAKKHLGFSVHIPVKGHSIPLFIRACHHVRSEVYPPQAGVQLNDFDAMETGLVVGVIYATGVVALAHQFHLTVAINVGCHTVVEFIL